MNIDKSPMMRAIKLWNVIPQSIQHALTKVNFKNGINNCTANYCGKQL